MVGDILYLATFAQYKGSISDSLLIQLSSSSTRVEDDGVDILLTHREVAVTPNSYREHGPDQ